MRRAVRRAFCLEGVAAHCSLSFSGFICRGALWRAVAPLLSQVPDFFFDPLSIAMTEMRKLLQLQNPRMEIQQAGEELLQAVRLLVAEDPCGGQFVFGRQELKPKKEKFLGSGGGDNLKGQLQTLLSRAGHDNPTYKTKQLRSNSNLFRAMVEFNGMQFISEPCGSKKQAEMSAASEALDWLIGGGEAASTSSPSRDFDHMSMAIKKTKKHHHHHRRT